jgi:formylmethanofuran dehydrogenase subunit E
MIVEKFELKEEETKPVFNQSGVCQQCGELAKELKEVDGVLICDKCAS